MSRLPSREEVLFADALAQPDAGRAAFLDQACRDDPGMHARVAALLAAHARADSLQLSVPPRCVIVPEEIIGNVIGRYKLLLKIGEGGCGVVFLAEQKEPVQRRVALKVIKAGMDTREVIARFEAERQALALMDHPGICKVLDAGSTEAGRPYFVMELVRGVPITKYCDDAELPTSARLNLFMQVCGAVQHAHQKGIIHRDLKPSNILVTVQGADAAPKVIDFGIAKATQGRLTDATLVTAFEQFMGTPAYMSPEQAAMSALDIDTRSDVYSLGVLLYELLTGRPPFDPKTLVVASRDELRRIIREVEPPIPSTHLATLAAADWRVVAKRRGTDPARLRTQLRGDLDWIVMKAMEKNRARRYETPAALAEDIARHLRHDIIVAARPGRLYRARKFTQRHRFGVAAATAVTLVLVAGIITSTWQAVRAKRAEKVAVEERARADALLDFMIGDFRTEVQKVGKLDLLEKVFDKAVGFLGLTDPMEASDETAMRYAKIIRQTGQLRLEQARYADAMEAFQLAYAITSKRFARHPQKGEMLFERAQAEFYISTVHRKRADITTAGEWMARYRDSAAELVKLDPAKLSWQQEYVSAQHNFAVLELDRGNLEAARKAFLAKLAMSQRMAADRPDDLELQSSLARTDSFLGTIAERSGDYSEALQRYANQTSRLDALVAKRPLEMEGRLKRAISLSLQIDVLMANGHRAEARDTLARAFSDFDAAVAHDGTNFRWLLHSLAAGVKQVLLDRAEGAIQAATARLNQLRLKIEKLAAAEPSDWNLAGLVVTACRLEAELRMAANQAGASQLAIDAVDRAALLLKADLADSKILGECAQAYVTAGTIAHLTAQPDVARQHWQRAIDVVGARVHESRDWRLIDPVARALAYLNRGDESRAMITRLHALGYRPLQPWPEAVATTLSVSPNNPNR